MKSKLETANFIYSIQTVNRKLAGAKSNSRPIQKQESQTSERS